ncbi:MAG: hypothetical protein C4K60_21050 [Ideonella sp. MAG2]|nr:MAG: hypothetical protein C4K60_21050 [Ideonella sp. MAG2]
MVPSVRQHAMKSLLKKLWNADFTDYSFPDLKYFWILLSAYIVFEGLTVVQVPKGFMELYSDYINLHPELEMFRHGSLVIAFVYFVGLFWFVQLNERAAAKTIGAKKLRAQVAPHTMAYVLDILVVIFVIYLMQNMIGWMTGRPISLMGLLDLTDPNHPFKSLIDFYNRAIPTYIELPYLLALLLTLILADLPIYAFHYATHKSRFLWYVMHRSHHSAEYLHPFGTGPNFGFTFIFLIPAFLFKLGLSKMFYNEPILDGLLIYNVMLFVSEKFNHSSAFYHVTSSNRYLHFVFRFLGNGSHHVVHHSAREGEEMVNLGNAVFNFWDRIFGTFREPDKTIPPLGLTNQPKLRLNPLRLYFGGVCTIAYEIRHNHPRYWFKIIFGSVFFTPPKTKEYLIESYPEKMWASQ